MRTSKRPRRPRRADHTEMFERLCDRARQFAVHTLPADCTLDEVTSLARDAGRLRDHCLTTKQQHAFLARIEVALRLALMALDPGATAVHEELMSRTKADAHELITGSHRAEPWQHRAALREVISTLLELEGQPLCSPWDRQAIRDMRHECERAVIRVNGAARRAGVDLPER